MRHKHLRWGILSTADIAKKNWLAIRNSGNGVVTAVASRDKSRSQQFIDSCQMEAPFADAPRALGSYEELLAADDVDALYIPLPTGLRSQWVSRAAAAGKHVVCEKPCARSLKELQEITDACRKNNVQFIDGVMFMHSQRLDQIRQVLDAEEKVGKIKRICTQFSFCGSPEFVESNIRVRSELEPHGCLGDLGWYNIRFTLWAMQWKMPKQVTGRLLSMNQCPDSADSVPTEFSGEMIFDDGISASFYCSFLTALQQWAIISGDKGQLFMDDFVLPWYDCEVAFRTNNPAVEGEGCDRNFAPHYERHAVREYANSHKTAQETGLFRNFANQVFSGKLNEDLPMHALKTQEVMECCLTSARANGKPVDLLLVHK